MSSEALSTAITFTDWEKPGRIPTWANSFNAVRKTVSEVSAAPDLGGVIVLGASSPSRLKNHKAHIDELGKRLEAVTDPFKLVVNLSGTEAANPDALVGVLQLFPRTVCNHIEFAFGATSLREQLLEALAKYQLLEADQHIDPLAEAREVIESVRPLLSENGRLSAIPIARALGLSVSKLANLMGKTKQAVSKTPDAPKIQSLLRPYERVIRLRSVLSEEDFKAWLEGPTRELDEASPKDLIADGRVEIVADLVEDMLLGSPS